MLSESGVARGIGQSQTARGALGGPFAVVINECAWLLTRGVSCSRRTRERPRVQECGSLRQLALPQVRELPWGFGVTGDTE